MEISKDVIVMVCLYLILALVFFRALKDGYIKNAFMYSKRTFKKIYLVYIACFLVVVILCIAFVDVPVLVFFEHHQWLFINYIKEVGNTLGNSRFLIPVLTAALVGVLLFDRKKRAYKLIMVVVTSVAIGALAQAILKVGFTRGRPNDGTSPWNFFSFPSTLDQNRLAVSMPSGHTTVIFAAFVPLALAVKNRFARIVVLCFPFITLFSRVYSSHHWTSDVLVGAVVGSGIGYIFYRSNFSNVRNVLPERGGNC